MSEEEKQRQKDIDSLLEIYRTAMQLGKWGRYVLYIVGAVLGILLSIKKLRQ
jgi:hypothetical protein